MNSSGEEQSYTVLGIITFRPTFLFGSKIAIQKFFVLFKPCNCASINRHPTSKRACISFICSGYDISCLAIPDHPIRGSTILTTRYSMAAATFFPAYIWNTQLFRAVQRLTVKTLNRCIFQALSANSKIKGPGSLLSYILILLMVFSGCLSRCL